MQTLLIAILLLSLPLSWFAVRMEEARRQREAVEEIERLGGGVCFDHTGPSAPDWMRKCLGDDLFRDVIVVHFETPLPWESTEANDAWLERLTVLTDLRVLTLYDDVSDAGLEHLKGLSALEELSVGSVEITDVGLMHLTGLAKLQLVQLHCTQVTDEGMDRFREALPTCGIQFD